MYEITLPSSSVMPMENVNNEYDCSNNIIISHRISDSKRKGLMKPIIAPNKIIDVSCMICNKDKLNASGVCYLCNRVICSYHTLSIDEKKYCTLCRESQNSGPVLRATSEHYNRKRKWKFCCFF
jgi:hypothetical protein